MTILSGDIKLVASSVMNDALEGGGAPSPSIIADGTSNAIFPDISEVDRSGGRVNLRKVFASVQTSNTDTFLGANVIVAEPPSDPRVSVTLFSTESVFDTRTQATTRVESYLNKGAQAAGYLFENHIAGQRVIQLFQRPEADVPVVGQTVVLVQNEGLSNEKAQYVRATAVSKQERQFYDTIAQKDFPAAIITIEISDALRDDFTGSPATRTFTAAVGATRVRETLVADAGVYAGVQPLAQAASLGDFTITAASIFTQLVPSAQTETPITDVKTNGLSAALAPSGGPVTQSVSLAFTTTQSMFLGGPVFPGSLSIVRSGVTLTDSAGVLKSAGTDVGTVDYDNGIASLSTNVFGTSGGTHTVTFQPAAAPDLISEQNAIRVTAESRSLSYVFTLGNIPLPGTLTISYMAQGRWYILRDNKGGVLKGGSDAFGTGTLNYTTGSVVITLGALPDVGSAIVVSSYSADATVTPSNTDLLNGGHFFAVLNTSGQSSEEKGAKTIAPNGLTVTWANGGTKTATDDGLGNLTGDATGTVDYSSGVVHLSPNTLPAPGTVFLMDANGAASVVASGVNLISGNMGATNITPGSIVFTVAAEITCEAPAETIGSFSYYGASVTRTVQLVVYDRGGALYFRDFFNNATEVSCGSVNYSTGTLSLNIGPTVGVGDNAGPGIAGRYIGSGSLLKGA